jgi:peptidoglycan/xylan/chitin deacetylase (PgdA/CDA1 family)
MLSGKQYSSFIPKSNRNFVSITFDDGRYEQYNKFYPLLAKYDLKGTFYIVTERIGWKGVMDWDELSYLHKEGNEIGSHTHTHPHLTTLSNSDLNYEFKKSKKILNVFNCNSIAYPYGEYNQRVIQQAKKYFIAARGYKSNIENRTEVLNFQNKNRYHLIGIPTENSLRIRNYPNLQNCSLFGLSLLNFKKTVKKILEYTTKNNAWIIFVIHGSYNRKQISWILKKPRNIIEHFSLNICDSLKLINFTNQKETKKGTIAKFKWMCKYISTYKQIEVMPIIQVVKNYSTSLA